MARILLASRSPHRLALLTDAGVQVEVSSPDVDERSLEAPLIEKGATPEEVSLALAMAKATNISALYPGAIVLGCDQVLALDGDILHKPSDMDQARRQLSLLSGRTHELYSAVAIVRDETPIWSHVGRARMTMRVLEPGFLDRHLARVGERILSSVGAYQIEGEGLQLFDAVEGDHFTIVGLPMLPVLGALRSLGAIDG